VEKLFHDELGSGVACVNLLGAACESLSRQDAAADSAAAERQGCGELTHAHVVLATVVEMVHMATLVHDDVLDEAELRRKGATINHLRRQRSGPGALLGDYLISHSYHLCSSLESQWASRAIAATTNRVCEGELLQIDTATISICDEATYLRIIERKTGVLCAACCQLGARFAGADEGTCRRMEMYGLSLGTAFQISG